jgi:RNA polymerase sigma-70 factor (ECF subfamily)
MPDQPLEGEETRRLVQEALQTLPEDQREAVSLKVWGDMSWLEIGRMLGVSDDTASRLFARGLKAIAPMLKGVSP